MKETTRTFYEQAVDRAVARIVGSLDDALELEALARSAALSPLHFHRIFRGIVGETPLELHRRLRLERAARAITSGDQPITTIAFAAGYETHESFTRAFRDAYAASPTELRVRAQSARTACMRPPQTQLTARSGIHFGAPIPSLTLTTERTAMNVDIQNMPEKRVAAVSHRGPYTGISAAFAALDAIVRPAGLLAHEGLEMVAVFHDDPETTPPAELRAHAGLVVPAGIALPAGLEVLALPAGKYAHTTHEGPYTLLGDAWSRFMGGWLAASEHRIGEGAMYERYLNTPMDTAPDKLKTELFLSIA